MCVDPRMWASSSAEIPPPSPRHGCLSMGRSDRMFSVQALVVCSAFRLMLQKRDLAVKSASVLSGEAASLLALYRSSLLSPPCEPRLPSVSPAFIYRLRNCRGGDGGRDGKSGLKVEDSAAPVYCLKKDDTTLLVSLSLLLSLLQSSSAPIWAGFKRLQMWRIQLCLGKHSRQEAP